MQRLREVTFLSNDLFPTTDQKVYKEQKADRKERRQKKKERKHGPFKGRNKFLKTGLKETQALDLLRKILNSCDKYKIGETQRTK
jgi:hypothetical protein